MCQEKNTLEIEVKFLAPPEDQLRRCLAAVGAVSQGRFFESNTLFDDSRKSLATGGRLLRLRRDQSQRLTYKAPEPGADPGLKIRREIELDIGDIDAMATILKALGFTPTLVYEKWRETFTADEVHVCIDTMPFGRFVEIEGAAEAIGPMARALGLRWEDRIVLNYHEIFGLICSHLGLAFADISFDHFKGVAVDLQALLPQMRTA